MLNIKSKGNRINSVALGIYFGIPLEKACFLWYNIYTHPPLAQLDRVSDSDSEGRRFESCRAGQSS